MILFQFLRHGVRAGARARVLTYRVGFVLGCTLLTACGAREPEDPAPKRVAVRVVSAVEAPIFVELSARVAAVRTAEIRARVTGIVLTRTFQEGALVEKGDVLFKIDPAALTAAFNQAQAELDHAQAEAAKSGQIYERYKRLVQSHAISRQDHDNAQAESLAASHKVTLAAAALDAAKLRLEYTDVKAPITGYIGLAQVSEGAFVSESDATLMAKIQQLDPVYVEATQSARLGTPFEQPITGSPISRLDTLSHPAFLTRSGQPYPHHGAAHVVDNSVDPLTERFIVRATFPNPNHMLLPGMFVRLRVPQGSSASVIDIPQLAIVKGTNGSPAVVVIDAQNLAQIRPVTLGEMKGANWQVVDGIKTGEHVVIWGASTLRAGERVSPYAAAPLSADADKTEN